jgi:alpha-glucosidase
VLDIPDADKQDPMFFHTKGQQIGRDGCRVPIPWTATGSSFGFGPEGSKPHLPQPKWMGEYAVEVEEKDPESTLSYYREALRLRKELQGAEELEWVGDEPGVLHFRRPGGWEVVLNLSEQGKKIDGEVLISSAPVKAGVVAQNVCVWFKSA